MTLTPDQINGCFELVAGGFNLLHVRALYREKTFKGVAWTPFVFFTLWGLWNLIFYPANHLWWSFYGGLLIVTVNAMWLWLAMWYYCGQDREVWNISTSKSLRGQ